ncbi:MAG: hypothetical protein CBC32_002340 [Proteobacteria bacterium TMED72]|nr:MAG: hypothetical protein CBC32_002340 [Proteobacteria bacterium TMED72]
MKRTMNFLILAIFFLLFSTASITQAKDGQALFFESPSVALDAGETCNGGSCQTKNGTVLSCPTAGGPICDDDKACICQCFKIGNTYTAANRCVDGRELESIAANPDVGRRCGS